jgi:hypothetical protein
MTCGVAKFSAELARRLGVPFCGLHDDWGVSPLLSLKWAEVVDPLDANFIRARCLIKRFGLFWHDSGDQSVLDNLTARASVVFYADPSLGSPGLWCPSLITPRKRPVRLFSFGMAHKLQTDKYKRVRELLDAAGERYHLRVSVGIHEGTSLDGAEKHFDALREIMGPEHVTILGILSDDAVSEELSNADYVLAFFEKGLRANNTTVHAAHLHGRRVISNFDEHSPLPLHGNVVDLANAHEWPQPEYPQYIYSWERLIEAMRKECDKSRSRIA